MDILDNTNSYKKLYNDIDKIFSEQKNSNIKGGIDQSKLDNLSSNLEEYKNINNTRIEKLFKLIDINTQNDKNNMSNIENMKSDVEGYKKLNDGRVDKLAKLFLLLSKQQ